MKKKIASKAMVFILLSVLVLPVRLYCDNMSGLALPFLYWPAEIILCLLFGLIVFLSITRMKTESRGVVFVVLEILSVFASVFVLIVFPQFALLNPVIAKTKDLYRITVYPVEAAAFINLSVSLTALYLLIRNYSAKRKK